MSISNDGINRPEVALGLEKFVTVYNKIFNITWDNGAWHQNTSYENMPDTEKHIFTDGRSLFTDNTFFFIEQMRSCDVDFGMLPYPKFDESQDEYYERGEWFMTHSVPVTNQHLDIAGAIFEAMSAESYNSVIPMYI